MSADKRWNQEEGCWEEYHPLRTWLGVLAFVFVLGLSPEWITWLLS